MISVSIALLVLAQPANPYLEEGRRLAKELKFAECIDQMRIAAQVRELSVPEKQQIFTLQARCQIAEGQRAEAEESFAQLLNLDPSTQLDPKESPKILEVFDAVKKRLYPADFVKLIPEPARPGQAIFKLVDPWRRVDAVVMVRRLSGETHDLKLPLVDQQVTAELDAPVGESLEWWLEARDASGLVVASFASGFAPQVYQVKTVDNGPAVVDVSTPRLQRAPAWIAIIGAIAACSAGAVLQIQAGVHSQQARDKTRPPGDWSDTARMTQDKAMSEATWATGLFIGAGVAGSAGVVLFAW